MTQVEVTRLSAALGAEVTGVDLRFLDAATEATLIELLAEHLVLTFPGQTLTPDEHVALGAVFGEPFVHPFLDAVEGHPEILEVVHLPEDTKTFGGEHWHADITFMNPPSSVSLLHSHVIPPIGGDTMFANQFMAFEHLSAGLQATLESLQAVHVYPGLVEGDPNTTAVHPVVRLHPVSGRRALFVNGAFVDRFDGFTNAESADLLQFLYAHQTRPEFVGRVSWTPGQLTMWDNRAVLHYAMNDYPGQHRHLQRVTVMER